MDDAVLIDGQLALHGQGIVLFGHKVLKVFAVLDGAADMQVDQIHVVHGGGVDLAVQAEGFGQMGNLQCAGDAVLPAYVCPDDISGPLGDYLSDSPVAASGGLCGGNRNIQSPTQLGILIKLKITEGFFKPLIVQFSSCRPTRIASSSV